MGIFQSRPEEPTEWAGLPAEPWEARVPAEVLPPPLGDLATVSSIDIAFGVPAATIAEVAVDADGDGD